MSEKLVRELRALVREANKETDAERTEHHVTKEKLDRCLYWLRVIACGRVASSALEGSDKVEQTAAMALEEIAKLASMNPKQEILDALAEIDYAFGTFYTERIRAILDTHTLEPIDERPFDPTLCGWENTYHEDGQTPCKYQWASGDYVISYDAESAGHIEEIAGACQFTFPWPATQSDGERLLKLLGVLK